MSKPSSAAPQPSPSPTFRKVETRFCPRCQSPAVNINELTGSLAECRVCKHQATLSDFPTHVLFTTRENVDQEALLQSMADDMRNTLGPILSRGAIIFLHKWGFLFWDEFAPKGHPEHAWQQKVIVVYLTTIARAVLRGIIEAREKIEPIRIKHEAERMKNAS